VVQINFATEQVNPTAGPTAPTAVPTAPTKVPTAPTAGPTAPTTPPTAPTAGPTVPTASPTEPPAAEDDRLSEYTYSASLIDGLTVYWKPIDGDTIDMAVKGLSTGWVGVGWSANGHMDSQSTKRNIQQLQAGSDAIVGWVGSTGNVVIDQWLLTEQNTPTIHSNIELTNKDGEEINGETIIYFTRTTASGNYPINEDQSVILIGAYSQYNTDALSYHGDTHTSTNPLVTVNFVAGTVGSQKGVLGIKDAHAIIMFIAWGILLPFGVLWARYTRSLENDIWFLVHRPCQYFGFVLSTAGIILGYVMVGTFQFRVVAHSVIGTIIFAGSILQVVGAFFRPHKKKDEPITNARKAFEIGHHWNGRVLVLLSVAQIILGIYAIGYDQSELWVLWLYVTVVAIVGAFVLIVETVNVVHPIWGIVPCYPDSKKPHDMDYTDADF